MSVSSAHTEALTNSAWTSQSLRVSSRWERKRVTQPRHVSCSWHRSVVCRNLENLYDPPPILLHPRALSHTFECACQSQHSLQTNTWVVSKSAQFSTCFPHDSLTLTRPKKSTPFLVTALPMKFSKILYYFGGFAVMVSATTLSYISSVKSNLHSVTLISIYYSPLLYLSRSVKHI